MKILLLHEFSPPEVFGGGELLIEKIYWELVRRGIDTTLVTGSLLQTTIRKINSNSIIKFRIPHRYLLVAYSRIISNIVKKEKPDLIQTTTFNMAFPGYFASRKNNIPISLLVHGVYGNKFIEMFGNVKGTIKKIGEKIIMERNYNVMWFLSQFSYDLAKISFLIKPEKVVVQEPGPIKTYKPLRKEPYVLFVGRLSPQKGISWLIKLAKTLKEVDFYVVGRGELQKFVMLASRKLENIKYFGYVDEAKLAELYGKALIFILPSVYEGFGFSILEAMSAGCIVISTVPLKYYGRYVRNVKDEFPNVVREIRYYIENYKESEVLGRKNVKLLREKYSWKKFFSKLLNTYSWMVEL